MLSQQLVDDLINPGNTNIHLGLDRMRNILSLLDNPQDKYKVIHITGTNGKGSTAALLETGLFHASYRVGKYTSPYIHIINECICLNHEFISDSALEQVYCKIKRIISLHNLFLSPFEFLTAIMFEYFAQQNIDWLILEVGMGGLNDATNVVNSAYSIITNIALEHTKWLGSTLSQIAHEKCGIIKHGITIIADDSPELINAVKAKTTNYINVLDYYQPRVTLDTKQFTTIVKFQEKHSYCLSLFGKFQAYNFLCAYAVFTDLNIKKASIRYAAKHTRWPGRLQVVSANPLIILDATHNAHGAAKLCETMSGIFAKDDIVIITSILADKDIPAMLRSFSQLTNSIIYTTIDNNQRGMKAEDIAKHGAGVFDYTQAVTDPKEALAEASKLNKKCILISGSLYLLSYFHELI